MRDRRLIKNIYNKTQRHLVEMSERAHEAGFRHKGLSGTICENLVTEALRNEIPKFSFGRGIISFAADTSVAVNSKYLSPQLDIIIYQGRPLARIGDHVIVRQSQAKGIIEVKKWLNPRSLIQTQAKLVQLKQLVDPHPVCKHEISLFLVSFRFKDRQEIRRNWFTETKGFAIKNRYCFSGNYSMANGVILYPWQETWWEDFDSNQYAGEYEHLVKDIQSLI